MWTVSSPRTKCLLLLLLALAGTATAQKKGFDANDLKSLLGDLSSLDSEEADSILKSFSPTKDAIFTEESKKSLLIRVKPAEDEVPDKSERRRNVQRKKIVASSKDYDIVQSFEPKAAGDGDLESTQTTRKVQKKKFGPSSKEHDVVPSHGAKPAEDRDLESSQSTRRSQKKKIVPSSKDHVVVQSHGAKPGEDRDLEPSQSTRSTQKRKIVPSSKEYEIVQWYESPSRTTEHHITGRKQSSGDQPSTAATSKHDMKAQGTTYSTTNFYHDSHEEHYDDRYPHSGEHHHDDHYHVDHESPPADASPSDDERNKPYSSYSNHEEPKSHDAPSSDVFYKKMKVKKVKKTCKKHKKHRKPDSVVSGRTNSVPEVSSHYQKTHTHSVPALPDTGFDSVPQYPRIPDPSPQQLNYPGDILKTGVPRTHFFQYKDGEKVNHYHLHNHQYVVNANGQKVRKAKVPDYRNLANQFQKLKSELTSPEDSFQSPSIDDSFKPSLGFGSPNPLGTSSSGTPKLGYHYTGPHESYGRKTYKRINPSQREKAGSFFGNSNTEDKVSSFYGENPEDKVSSYYNHNSGEKASSYYNNDNPDGHVSSFYGTHDPEEKVSSFYNSDHPDGKVSSFYNSDNPDGKVSSSYDSRDPEEKVSSFYNSDKPSGQGGGFRYGAGQYGTSEFSSVDNKGPYPRGRPYSNSGEIYEPVRSKPQSTSEFEYNSDSPMTPYKPFSGDQDSGYHTRERPKKTRLSPEEKAPYAPPKPTPSPKAPVPEGPSSAEFNPGPPYGPSAPFGPRDPGPHESGVGQGHSPPFDAPVQANPLIPPTVTHSVSYSGEGDPFGGPLPFAPGPSLFIRPGPDPLTIPKNAKVFEHHIRLHPMHYNIMAMGRAMNYQPVSFSNNVYPVPLHKLISDPMKMPLVPMAPMPHAPPMNPMLRHYRGPPPMPTRFW